MNVPTNVYSKVQNVKPMFELALTDRKWCAQSKTRVWHFLIFSCLSIRRRRIKCDSIYICCEIRKTKSIIPINKQHIHVHLHLSVYVWNKTMCQKIDFYVGTLVQTYKWLNYDNNTFFIYLNLASNLISHSIFASKDKLKIVYSSQTCLCSNSKFNNGHSHISAIIYKKKINYLHKIKRTTSLNLTSNNNS